MTSGVTFDDPFYEEVSKYAVRFAVPVVFGESPASSYKAALRNGTATLLILKDRFLAVTCQHVLAGFRELKSVRKTMFQVGTVAMDPDDYLVSEDESLDLAVLDLTSFVGVVPGLTESQFVSPRAWPPAEVTTEDVLCLAGFPGIWRDQIALGHLRLYSLSSGASEVLSVQPDRITTAIQIDDCISQINHGVVLGSLGGISGGPVFAWRKHSFLIAELVGFIYEYQEALDLLFVRSAAVLDDTGLVI
jgi:hypothetical protein